ncbi:MAG: glycosyltransferase family 4 protein [Microgenomates group bacterium]
MKILLIRPAKNIGGAEIYNLNLIQAFKKYFKRYKLFFITTLPKFSGRIKNLKVEVKVLSLFSKEIGTRRDLIKLFFGLPKYLFLYIKTILIFYKKKKIRIICLQSATEKIILTPILKILGFKIIWIEHGPFFMFKPANEVKFLYRLASNFATKIIAVSENVKQNAIKNKIKKEKLICVHTGIKISDYDIKKIVLKSKKIQNIISRLNKIINHKLTVGYLGDFSFGKGIIDFLNVSKEVIKKYNNIKFLLIGEGELFNKFNILIRKEKIEEFFILLGYQKYPFPFLKFFDILFYPNKVGGISMVLLEAMAMGIPVVARDIGGNRELVVHGKTGYLFKDETPEELANIIIGLLKDEKKRKAMGKAAQERVKKYFNEERWIKQMYQVFKEVAEE